MKFSRKFQPFFELFDPKREVREKHKHIRYVILIGGRGSGKSFALNKGAEEATYCKYSILFTRYTMTSAETSIIPEFASMCESVGNDSDFSFSRTRVTNNVTGAVIDYKGLKPSSNQSKGALKSVSGKNVLILEEAEDCHDFELFDKVDNSIRMQGKHNIIILCLNQGYTDHWIYKEFIKEARDDVMIIETTYLDNLKHLDESFIKKAEREKERNPTRYAHVFLNKWRSEVEGALWSQSKMIDPYRVQECPDLRRIVVAVDPNVTDPKKAKLRGDKKPDECGVVVAGKGFDDRYYVLHDASGLMSPADWAKVAVGQYKNYKADRIIYEKNQGGELVRMTIENVDKSLKGKIKDVNASRGKITRAEPIAALYEEGLVSHVGGFAEMEGELTSYTGEVGEVSPNRFDALVWALTELSQNNSGDFGVIMF